MKPKTGNRITQIATDINRYKELQARLNPNNDKFVIMESTDDWREFNRLTIKLAPVIALGCLEMTETKL